MTAAQEQAFLQLMQHLIYASDLIEKLLLLVGDDWSDEVAAELRRRADEIASKVDRGALDSEALIRAALARRAALRVYAMGTDHEVLQLAIQVLGNEEEARRWLNSAEISLGGRRPRDANRETVMTLLTRMQYGVFT